MLPWLCPETSRNIGVCTTALCLLAPLKVGCLGQHGRLVNTVLGMGKTSDIHFDGVRLSTSAVVVMLHYQLPYRQRRSGAKKGSSNG